MLISKRLSDLINEQIAHERYNANLYLYIAGFLKNRGLNNLAKHFESQHDEENGHSLEFYNLLTDLNVNIFIPTIAEVAINFLNIQDIAAVYLRQEIVTTEKIEAIKQMAIEERNPVVEEKAREMIKKQQHEYEEATNFVDVTNVLREWWQIMLYDASIGGK
jgi:ferritin